MPVSYREALSQIGEPKAGRNALSYREDFPSRPTSMSAAVRSMTSPRPDQWWNVDEGHFVGHDWTEECQGVTSDGSTWYLSSNNSGKLAAAGSKRRVYKFSLENDIGPYVAL